jgi:hypothetical protein
MSIFDELQAAYRASQDRYREYVANSLLVAHALAHEFQTYLGTPETYTDLDDETRRPYVRLLSFQLPDGVPAAVPPETSADILSREEDGFWRFVISLTLDRDAASFPKQSLAFFIRLKIHGDVWHVQLLDDGYQDFRIAGTGDPKLRGLFERMVEMVERLLAAKPWEGVERLPIGFELPHPPTLIEPEAPVPAAP